MSAVIRPRATQSPCNGVCRMDDTSGLCMGCGRTFSEIGDWGSMNDAQRARIRDLEAQVRAGATAATYAVEEILAGQGG